MVFRSRAWLVVAALSLAAVPPLVASRDASAQQPIDAARARELFREALALLAAGDYATALSKLQQVATFKDTPQVRFNIGVCQEKLGRFVVALGEYRIALADAEQDKNARKVVEEATRAINALEPRIPTLTLSRGEGSSSAAILVDGKALVDSQIGSAILLDPGEHTIGASANGYEKFLRQVRLAESEKASVEIVMKRAAAAPPSAPPPEPSAPKPSESAAPAPTDSAPEPIPPEPPSPEVSSSGAGATFGWIALGVGAVGGALATYGYLKRSSAISDLDAQCGADKQQCPSSAQSILDDGKSATTLGNVGLAIGLVGVTTGIILLATSGGSKPSEKPIPAHQEVSRLRFVPAVSVGWAGAVIDGRF